ALCHTTEPGKNKIGPSLAGVMDREPGTAPNFNYSDAMKNFKHKWTLEELDIYLTDPRKLVPGTKMIFPGLKDEKDRQNVIAYLQTLK
ncbi:MAG TPA: c-type cytochrome, partial [Stellaceae bacterium]